MMTRCVKIPSDLSPDGFRRAEKHLTQLDAEWAAHVLATGPCAHATKPAREPYEALVRAIAYQQLHAKAGDAILARFLALYPGENFPTPERLLALDPAIQRASGFSATKIATIRGIAQGAIDGAVPNRETALEMTDDALVQQLAALKGVGRWTVEMFLIYTLERSDILPADDFGVRRGFQRLKGLSVLPTPKAMRNIGETWAPFRTVASWYLWRLPKI